MMFPVRVGEEHRQNSAASDRREAGALAREIELARAKKKRGRGSRQPHLQIDNSVVTGLSNYGHTRLYRNRKGTVNRVCLLE
jgi:hypothetical protein